MKKEGYFFLLFLIACAPRPFTNFGGPTVKQGSNICISYEGYNPTHYLYPIEEDNFIRTKTLSLGFCKGKISTSKLVKKLGIENFSEEGGIYTTIFYPHPYLKIDVWTPTEWQEQSSIKSIFEDLCYFTWYWKGEITGKDNNYLSISWHYALFLDTWFNLFLGYRKGTLFSPYLGGTLWALTFLNDWGFSLRTGFESRISQHFNLGYEFILVRRMNAEESFWEAARDKVPIAFFDFGIQIEYRIK